MDFFFLSLVLAFVTTILYRSRDTVEMPVEPSNSQTPPYEPTTTSTTPEEPVLSPTEPPKYKWDTVGDAKHSVRLICDEEGLTLKQKDELCATVGAESGWQSYYLTGKKKGQPVKLENKDKTGRVWSTDYGICQINTYFHIGESKTFPSPEYVLNNPEKCIRWMCRQWKAGNAKWWVAYKSGAYKAYL